MRPTEILVKTISTFFYTGYFPLIPGTFASAVAVVIVFLIGANEGLRLLLTAVFLLAGFFTSGRAEKLFGRKDARCIVIDEFSGIFISFLFVPYDIRLFIVGFVIFRILDALKPYPAGRLEQKPGSVGIMADDIVAGIYTNIILQFVFRFTFLRIS